MLWVESYREYAGRLYPGIHEPIVDITTWNLTQAKLKKPIKGKTIIVDEMPLRGVLKCHCGCSLTGAPSRSKSGKYFYYYKCNQPKHNNISAVKAHDQLLEACKLMSLPKSRVEKIRIDSKAKIEAEMKVNKKKVFLAITI
ncbi:MAG: zinc ribbon domain-containing protein [Leadbetterella sp.]|nr:zinc ribbon domain-containing protein [Leadbetterella sp.]